MEVTARSREPWGFYSCCTNMLYAAGVAQQLMGFVSPALLCLPLGKMSPTSVYNAKSVGRLSRLVATTDKLFVHFE